MLRIWFVTLITMFFLASSLHMTENYASFGINMVYASMFLFVISLFFLKDKKLKYNGFTLFLIVTFLIFVFLSSLINGDSKTLIRGMMFVMLLFTANIIIPTLFKEESIAKIVVFSVMISQLPLLILPYLINGIDSFPYFGIFSNTNSLGGVGVTILTISMALLFKQIENILFYKNKTKKKYILLNLIVVSFMLLLVSYASSRTSFLVVFIVTIVGLTLLFINALRLNKVGNILFKGLFLAPVATLIYFVINYFFPIKEVVSDNIISKFKRKSGNVLDGRSYIWQVTVDESGFFGRGADFFYNTFQLGSHNTFIMFLGNYGWIPMIAMVLFFGSGLFYTFKRFLNDDTSYKYIPILSIVLFLSLSMAEDMSYKLSLILSIIFIGYSMNDKKIKLVQSEQTVD